MNGSVKKQKRRFENRDIFLKFGAYSNSFTNNESYFLKKVVNNEAYYISY